jgi:RNA polymerase sigma factor (sigma-70 family)
MTNTATPAADERLVRAARGGDAQAFDALIRRHFGLVHAIALARLGEREAAEDLAQEVFLRAHLALPQLSDPGLFTRWLAQIARNLAATWQSRAMRRSALAAMVPLDEHGGEVPDTEDKGVRSRMETEEQQRAVWNAVRSLPPEERELVLMHFAEGLTQSEIGERLGVHQTTVLRRLKRALAAMRGALEPLLRESGPRLRASRGAAARASALVAAAGAMSATARASLAATAAASTPLVKAGSLTTIKAALAAGGSLMATGKGITVTIGVAALVAGGIYVTTVAQQGAPAPPLPPPPAVMGTPGFGGFAEAQMAAEVNRVRADMRAVATAIESYYVDNNSYPTWALGGDSRSVAQGNALLSGMPTFHRSVALPNAPFGAAGQPFSLTTPIAYMSRTMTDPFNTGPNSNYSYFSVDDSQRRIHGWILVSPGPDGVFNIRPQQDYDPSIAQPSPTLLRLAYDPTNGTVSGGDIFRVKQ